MTKVGHLSQVPPLDFDKKQGKQEERLTRAFSIDVHVNFFFIYPQLTSPSNDKAKIPSYNQPFSILLVRVSCKYWLGCYW